MIRAIQLKKIVIFVVIFCMIFAIFYYKNFLFGNNISKNRSGKDVLKNMEKYQAELDVTVISNKTQNKYVIKQEVSNDYCMQETIKGEPIEGVKIELNQNNLKISNTKLNLEKVYENYHNLLDHAMFLNSFVADYKDETNETNCFEENGEVIFEVKLNSNQNTYIKYKKFYVDAKTGKPKKLEIKDNTKKETICIIYNNIEFK